eukprot:1159186-Pelagomonas_calceolata.AAC.4
MESPFADQIARSLILICLLWLKCLPAKIECLGWRLDPNRDKPGKCPVQSVSSKEPTIPRELFDERAANKARSNKTANLTAHSVYQKCASQRAPRMYFHTHTQLSRGTALPAVLPAPSLAHARAVPCSHLSASPLCMCSSAIHSPLAVVASSTTP